MAVELLAILDALLGLVLDETLFPPIKGGQKRVPFPKPSFCFGPCLFMPLGCSLKCFWWPYASSTNVKLSPSSGSGTSSSSGGRGRVCDFDRGGKGECWLSTCSTREFKACIPTRIWLSICSTLGVVSVAWPLSVVPWWFGA